MEEEEVGIGLGAWAWAGVCAWARASVGAGAPGRSPAQRFGVANKKSQQRSSDGKGKCSSGALGMF